MKIEEYKKVNSMMDIDFYLPVEDDLLEDVGIKAGDVAFLKYEGKLKAGNICAVVFPNEDKAVLRYLTPDIISAFLNGGSIQVIGFLVGFYHKINYSDKLIKLRKKKGFSRQKVADDLGISLSAVQMYENGERVPRDSIKMALADYYGTSVQRIFF